MRVTRGWHDDEDYTCKAFVTRARIMKHCPCGGFDVAEGAPTVGTAR